MNYARTRRVLRRAKDVAAIAAAMSVTVGATWMSSASAEDSAPSSFGENEMTLVATHQWADAQPTYAGQRLVELEVADGKVWAGYGDYGANTGPITLAAYDPAIGGGFSEAFVSDTEAVYNLRTIDGTLYAPATDPRTIADFATSSPWTDRRPLGATHVFDTADRGGEDLWMVGSQGADAVAWRSLDGGRTWTEAQRVSPDGTQPSEFMRFYFVGVISSTVYVQPVSSVSGASDSSLAFDGRQWRKGPDLVPDGGVGWSPEVVADGFAYHASGHGNAGNVYFFDGRRVRTIGFGFDVEVDQGALLLLDEHGHISRSFDQANWEHVISAPTNSRSLAVDGDQIYVGTDESQLWSAQVVADADAIENVSGPSKKDLAAKCPKGWERRGRC